jgi:threonine dehydrogenase-like Zn-dependent dehydrogenase
MITLLHGDYIEASREALHKIQKTLEAHDVRHIDDKSIDETLLTQAVESSSLFGNSTAIVVEKLFSRLQKQSKKISLFASILSKNAKKTTIVLWESKEIGPQIIKLLGRDVAVQKFSLPVVMFQFLDNIRPGNRVALCTLYRNVLASEPIDLIFSMLAKRIRQLIQIASGASPANLAPWQIHRLTIQSKSFTMKQLIDMYTKLHALDVQGRMGKPALELSKRLELFLAEM